LLLQSKAGSAAVSYLMLMLYLTNDNMNIMTRFSLITLIALFFCACQTSKQEAQTTTDTTAVAIDSTTTDSLNQLSPEQVADGWHLLFDGKDLSKSWRFYQNKPNNSWEVVDGTLHCKPFDGNENRADLITNDQYKNFELVFDWQVSKAGNSGVMFRVTEDEKEPYLSGPEYQVIDDIGWPGDPLKDSQLTGSNYDMHAAPKDKPMNPIGEWNTSKILVNENHVEHWLNGIKLFEYELQSEDWKKRKNNSKWKDVKSYGMAEKGHIALQDHGQEVWFRNVMIRPL
jgi:hypothetical protein